MTINYAERWDALRGRLRRVSSIHPASQDVLAINHLRHEGGLNLLCCFTCGRPLTYPDTVRVAILPGDWALVMADHEFDGGMVVGDVLQCSDCATKVEDKIRTLVEARRTA